MVNSGWSAGARPTRRELLRIAAAAGVGALAASGIGSERRQPAQPTSQPESAPAHFTPWWMKPPHTRSRVVDIRSRGLADVPVVEEAALRRALASGVQALTGASDTSTAWRVILGPARRIVLKFNAVGAETIDTNEVMAKALVSALAEAGYDPAEVALVETPSRVVQTLDVRQPEPGWGAAISVGDHLEPVANYVHAADAIINVPFLKAHQIAGMSGAMKNISHAVIRHPGLFHGNGCSPYVGQVIGSKEISSRLRLNVVNALRIVFRNGPEANVDDVCAHGGLLLGYDPVAVDTAGLALLALHRSEAELKKVPVVRYLESAASAGVGRREGHELDQVVLAENG